MLKVVIAGASAAVVGATAATVTPVQKVRTHLLKSKSQLGILNLIHMTIFCFRKMRFDKGFEFEVI